MEPFCVAQVAQAVGGSYNKDAAITSVCIDTREVQPGSLFVAIQGERFDGHDFIPKAFELGAAAVLSHRAVETEQPVVFVKDTRLAYRQLAAWYRQQFPLFMAAVTGSVGKTSTKDMIYAVLSSQWKTLKTEGNLNNEIGLPKTLLRLDKTYQAAVIEMGMSDFGEISILSETASANVGVITNIGVSHIETLGSREGILQAKLEILDGLNPSGALVLNADDDLLQTVRLDDRPVVRYGLQNPDADICAVDIERRDYSMAFAICYNGNRYPAQVPAIGEHHVSNALAAFAVGVLAGMKPEQAANAVANYEPSGMRQRIREVAGRVVIEDCYNASPDSMQAALGVLSAVPCTGKRVAVLGDMFELGEYSAEAHRKVGKVAAEYNIPLVVCCGKEARQIQQAAKENGVPEAVWVETKEQAAEYLENRVLPGDAVLFKASRGMKLEELTQMLYGRWE